METNATKCPEAIVSEFEWLWEDWHQPLGARYIFFALDLESTARATGPIG